MPPVKGVVLTCGVQDIVKKRDWLIKLSEPAPPRASRLTDWELNYYVKLWRIEMVFTSIFRRSH